MEIANTLPEVAWLLRQVVMFAAYFYLHLLLVFVMTAICFPDTFLEGAA